MNGPRFSVLLSSPAAVLLVAGFAVAAAATTPQIIPARCEALVVSGATRDGRVDLARLGLGNGGIDQPAAPSRAGTKGELTSAGGVWIRARAEGVKLDFPNGQEVLISPTARLHLRSGEQTLPFLGGLRLVLADGTQITTRRGSPRTPLQSVDVDIGGADGVRRIWYGNRRAVDASHSAAFSGTTVLMLGDGRMAYRADVAGPLIALERVLCPASLAAGLPNRRLVVIADVLTAGMQKLPARAPRKSVQFPQVAEAARRFALLSQQVFQNKITRPPGAVGQLWFGLDGGYRLKVESAGPGVVMLGFYGRDVGVPGVEWCVGADTTIHLVRPDGGLQGGPRYFQKGIGLREETARLWPFQAQRGDRARVADMVEKLGGRAPRPLDVRLR